MKARVVASRRLLESAGHPPWGEKPRTARSSRLPDELWVRDREASRACCRCWTGAPMQAHPLCLDVRARREKSRWGASHWSCRLLRVTRRGRVLRYVRVVWSKTRTAWRAVRLACSAADLLLAGMMSSHVQNYLLRACSALRCSSNPGSGTPAPAARVWTLRDPCRGLGQRIRPAVKVACRSAALEVSSSAGWVERSDE